MKKIIIGLVILVLAITAISIGLIHSQNQAQLAAQETLPTVEDLIKKVEENVEKIQDLRADVKEIEQEMNVSKTEFSVKEVLKTTEYTFLFKKPDMIKIIPKYKDGVPKNREELNNFYKQHPDWTEDQRLEYYSEEYLYQNIDLIRIGQAEYYVDRGTKKLTDKMLGAGPMSYGAWRHLLEPSHLHLVHHQLRKLLEPFMLQNSLRVTKDEKNPDVYIIEGTYKSTPLDEIEKTSPYGWDYDVWGPEDADTEIEIKIDYKKGIILKVAWYTTDDFKLLNNNTWFPHKLLSWKPIDAEDKNPRYMQIITEFSNVEINKGILDGEFSFENTRGYDISRYRIKLLNEK
jgi:outer membrane lipoprotein-sorting protein